MSDSVTICRIEPEGTETNIGTTGVGSYPLGFNGGQGLQSSGIMVSGNSNEYLRSLLMMTRHLLEKGTLRKKVVTRP